MPTESYDQLAIFAAVSRERRFTRAAAKLGMSGAHVLRVIALRFEEINTELALLSEFRDKLAGRLRITAPDAPLPARCRHGIEFYGT